MKPQKIEDIYPLTIVHMRHGKIAIVETNANWDCVTSLQQDEKWQYHPHQFMKNEWSYVNFGIGDTLDNAFIDFVKNYKS